MINAVTVFCGSSFGHDPAYLDAARQTGATLAARGFGIVYGGGSVGLMGALADSALDAGGRVIGVIPRSLHERELTHQGLSELHVVETMHERKTLMASLGDAFLALPGGAGTLEEISEQWTWAQLNIHDKPSGFLDVAGYWDPIRQMRDRMVAEGFVQADQAGIITFADDLETLLTVLDLPVVPTIKRGERPQP